MVIRNSPIWRELTSVLLSIALVLAGRSDRDTEIKNNVKMSGYAAEIQMRCDMDSEAVQDHLTDFVRTAALCVTVASDGHEAGSLSSWVQALGLPVVCLETRHVRAAMAAQRNNANDALGIARIMRTAASGQRIWSKSSYRLRLLLIQRRNLKRKFLDIENSIRHSLKVFGLRFEPGSENAHCVSMSLWPPINLQTCDISGFSLFLGTTLRHNKDRRNGNRPPACRSVINRASRNSRPQRAAAPLVEASQAPLFARPWERLTGWAVLTWIQTRRKK